MSRQIIAVLALVIGSATAVLAQAPRPTVWMSPPGNENGKSFRDLFEHPDQWKETRAMADSGVSVLP